MAAEIRASTPGLNDPTPPTSDASSDFSSSPIALRPNQVDQLAEYEDVLTPAQQAILDAPLITAWKEFTSHCNPSSNHRFLAYILMDIVQSGGPQMKAEFRGVIECNSLCEKNSQIREALLQAAEEGSFRRIRRLAILRKPPAPPRPPRNKAHEEPIPDPRVDAWNCEYVGACHKLLINNINAMDRGLFYSNTTSIIQSAGTGKSRMVDEQAKLVFTIPFNVGKLYGANGEAAFPPPDRIIRRYLLEHIASKTGDEIGPIIMHFWIRLFLEIISIMTEWPSEPTYSALALKWHQYLSSDDHRRKLYESVVTRAQATEQQRPPLPVARVTASRTLSTLTQMIDNHVDESSKDEFHSTVKVMIYFDEAHVLAETLIAPTPRSANNSSYTSSPPEQTSSDPFLSQQPSTESPNRPRLSLYDIMLWSFHDFEYISVFVLFLSRTSLSTLVPPASEEDHRVSSSARRRHNGSPYFQAPITETSFDECPSLHIKAGDVCLSKIQQIKFLAQFGRPLFWTMTAAIESARNRYDLSTRLFDLAQMRLIGLSSLPSNLNPRIALLDVRLMFDYRSGSELARKTQEDLISNHMRLAYSLSQNQEHLQSGYSSEPILAEAAARMMHKILNSNPEFIVKTLQEIMSLSIIDFGQRGELIGRALLMQAYDVAVSITKTKTKDQIFSAGCTVISFIKALFVSSVAEDILNSIPSHGNGKKFQETFVRARMRFTHFAKIADNGTLSPDGVFAAFVRGFGIICPDHEGGIDLALPVAMVNDEDTPLSPDIMSVLLVRVARTSTKGATNLCRLDEAAIDFFPPGSAADKPVPYISLVMELGALTKELKRAGMPTNLRKTTTRSRKAGTKTNSATGSVPPMTRKRKAEQSELTSAPAPKVQIKDRGTRPLRRTPITIHPCYSIYAFGCSRGVYAVIGEWQEYEYAALLAGRGLLAGHPRQDKDSLECVQKMKPRWAWDDNSYHWVDLKKGDSDMVCSDGYVISGVLEAPLHRMA